MLSKKPDKGGDDSDDGGLPLTPGTEANCKKIDEQYPKVMNQGRPDLLSVVFSETIDNVTLSFSDCLLLRC